MKYRTLGKTNLKVSEIGLGTSYFQFMNRIDIEKMFNIVEKEGINLIDTADIYGNGLSESLIGTSLYKRNYDSLVITKVNAGYKSPSHGANYDISYLKEAVKKSSQRLMRNPIDVLLLHSSPSTESQFNAVATFMNDLKENGFIRFWGLSITTPSEVFPFLADISSLDVIEITYNLIYQEPRISIFKKLKSYGIGIIAKEVLHRGALTGKTATQISPLSLSLHKLRYEVFLELLQDIGNYMGNTFEKAQVLSYALGFVLSESLVSSALVGTSSPRHFTECINAYYNAPTNGEFYDRLRKWYN